MPPPPCPDIERVSSLRILGVIVNDRMTAADHVTMLLSSCSSLLYAMRVQRAHGIPATSLHDIFRATVVSRILYMRRQHGRECVHQLNVAVLTRCVAANASATVTTTCRLSLSCLTLPTMISSTASRSTLIAYYSHICLTNSIYLTNFEPARTTKLLSIKQNCSVVQISSCVCCTNTPIKYVIRATLRD